MILGNEIIVSLVAMTPISELRGAIPLAIIGMGMSPLKSFLIAVVSNAIPVIIILKFIGPVSDLLRKKFKFFDNFFTWLFKRTRNKFIRTHERWGELALIIFVALPLPVTGAWTGALAAWLFGFPFKKALSSIFLGLIVAGIIVTLLTLGILSF